MKFEMVQCDDCACEYPADGAPEMGWVEKDGVFPGQFDLCPSCADERALEAEHDLDLPMVGYD